VTASWFFLLVSLWGASFTWNVFRPRYAPASAAALSFAAGWLTSELALHHILWQAIMTVVFVWAGALAGWPGWLGLAITLASWIGLAGWYGRAHEAAVAVEEALRFALGGDYLHRVDPVVRQRIEPRVNWRHLVAPVPFRPKVVERIRNVRYGREGGHDLHLDLYRHRDDRTRCPVLLQIHGGAWIAGSKNEQGLPLMLQVASHGWLCVSINYRLSPGATFPDPLIDVKRAIKWVREHIAEYGGDPEFLVLTGNSAGGQLAALAALTSNDPEYQPGFEEVDTSVEGCIAFYGVYDLMNRHGQYHNPTLARILEKHVMKSAREDSPDAYHKASPLSQVHADAPPFFVLHGDQDTLVPVADARYFADALRQRLHAPVAYAEIPGAPHYFEIIPSLRATFILHGVERFLAYLYATRHDTRPVTRPERSRLRVVAS